MPSTADSVIQQKLLVVGPRRAKFTDPDLSELHSSITRNPDLAFLLEAVTELEGIWPTIKAAHSGLSHVHGDKSLSNIRQYLGGGKLSELTRKDARHDIIVVDVVTVLSHVVDFYRLSMEGLENFCFTNQSLVKTTHRLRDSQGFCLGFLTAAAIASAKDKTSFEDNVRTVLRIAVCIAALVEADALDLQKSGARSALLSVSWNTQIAYERLLESIAAHPTAYISCRTDKNRITVTTLDHDIDALEQQLLAEEASVRRLPIEGRYHCQPAHEHGVRSLKALFQRDARFQMPNVAELTLPLRSNVDGSLITSGFLHDIALNSILLRRCEWYDTVSKAAVDSNIRFEDIVQVGTEATVPRSLKYTSPQMQTVNGLNGSSVAFEDTSAVAVIGMACRYPDADSLEEFWDLLHIGKSAVKPVPATRFQVSQVTREPKSDAYWGNFLRRPDQFDHRFFGFSGREAKYMDPQQRLVLQVAYEALESAGYFGVEASTDRFPEDVGCYLGVGSVDYADNIASHDATAFSVLGMLRAFISGRLSHYFGWTGPSITYDTACSSGAVAIHSAVTALKNGECSLALAGGVNVITSPALFQNLSAASFLSATGASKAFDADANGYCRGEGAGLLLLKPLARARADGDSILAVITGSAVNQGSNCSPITVPVSSSQSALYKKALSISGTDPFDVTFVEAHGTGTPVGDPIECESIRRTFGGSKRTHDLYLGSVKDNIGHTEAASGAAALIKTILMLQKHKVPKQAGFKRLNPKIPPLEQDRIKIPRRTEPWNAPRLVAVVNNYGAAGSNAAIVVAEARSTHGIPVDGGRAKTLIASGLPFLVSAKTSNSLRAYCKALKASIPAIREASGKSAVINLAYNLSFKQNRSLLYRHTFTASTTDEVLSELSKIETQSTEPLQTPESRKPVVLCIGGQNGRTVHLDEGLYRSSKLLQRHLNDCEHVCNRLGLPSLYPAIFSPAPVQDLVSLHSLLFSLQYASARAWLDSGLKVESILGHSFGQLTALVVAGGLSLQDGLRFIAARARLIQKFWGKETGEMLSVQGERDVVHQLFDRTRVSHPALATEVACYNGPQTVVLAGDRLSIDAVEETARSTIDEFGIKTVRLKNTHAFHSALVDAILPGLREVAATLQFTTPSIPIEACSKEEDWSKAIDSEVIVQHSRKPVHFYTALQRIESRLGACVFLEAGSASPIVPMARRALTAPNEADSEHVFQPIDLGPPNALDKLARATSNLWAAGINAQYWPFHKSQKDDFAWINLPPYQFQDTTHWLEYVAPKTIVPDALQPAAKDNVQHQPLQLLSLVEHSQQGPGMFVVNTADEMFAVCTRGHAVLGQSLCPASLYVELAVRAANTISRNSTISATAPCVRDLKISTPLSLASNRTVYLQLVPVPNPHGESWQFTVLSRSQPGATASTKHASGTVSLLVPGSYLDAPRMQFIRRIIGQSKQAELANTGGAHVLNGNIVYQVFGQVVDYAVYYRGIEQIISRDKEAVGIVRVPSSHTTTFKDACCDPITLDNFLQVAGINVNCLSEKSAEEVFVCTELGELFISDAFLAKKGAEGQSYRVYTSFESNGDKRLVNDIFVFDTVTGDLAVLFLGAIFQGVPMNALAKTLARLNGGTEIATSGDQRTSVPSTLRQPPTSLTGGTRGEAPGAKKDTRSDFSRVLRQVCDLFSRVIEIPVEEVKPDVSLDTLGVDSLMSSEILNEIKAQFDTTMTSEELLGLDDVNSVASFLSNVVAGDIDPAPSPQRASSEMATNHTDIPTQNGLSVTFSQIQEFLSKLLEIPSDEIAADTSLSDLGIDSLMATEVLNEIKKHFAVTISAEEFQEFQNVLAIATRLQVSSGTFTPPRSQQSDFSSSTSANGVTNAVAEMNQTETSSTALSAAVAYESFTRTRKKFDAISQEFEYADFYARVYPSQKDLVTAYIVEAFHDLGCSLTNLRAGDKVLDISVLDKHRKVKNRIYEILEDADIIEQDAAGGFIRTSTSVPKRPSSEIHKAIVAEFPEHAYEHNLLESTGSKLADCLTGRTDPLAILFGSAAARTLMENVYTHAPMFKTATANLAQYLVDIFDRAPAGGVIRILELGAGTGGTTKHLIESLLATGRTFEYTFTDISSSLVAAARKKFAKHDFMRYALLDIEKEPAEQFRDKYDIILSSNCIHATKDLTRSCTNIRACLRPEGVLCLVELTRALFWFDLVFGLLEGWWLAEDGRQHALASEMLWRKYLLRSGFRWIDWTEGTSKESTVLRVITASPAAVAQAVESKEASNETITTMETVAFKHADGVTLEADIYYPPEKQSNGVQTRPVALMIHGGGHVMLSRRDIRPAQTDMLLNAGFLPVSIDYRLCPEITLPEGPMKDARDALVWARNVLPRLPLQRPDIRADGDRVVAVGWSTGGHLALTLGFTATTAGVAPPNATLVFYCPSDYEDSFWTQPNQPFGQPKGDKLRYNLLEAVQKRPIVAYTPPAERRALGGWMSTADPRSRIALHMNWTGRYLRVLLNGLTPAGQGRVRNSTANDDPTDLLPDPGQEQIQSISPLAQIQQGKYRVPTFIIHGTKDDLIPWQQAVRTYDALAAHGIPAEIRILEGAVHLFDMYKSYNRDGNAQKAIQDGYNMLAHYVT